MKYHSIRNAIQRLGNTFKRAGSSKNNTVKIYENDIEALKTIAEYYESSLNLETAKDDLIYKMYIWIRGHIMAKYNSTPLDLIPQKQCSRLFIDNDNSYFENLFCDLANLTEFESICFEKGLSLKHPNELTEKERIKNKQNLSKIVDENDLKAFFGHYWTPDQIGDNLLIELNQLLFLMSKNN